MEGMLLLEDPVEVGPDAKTLEVLQAIYRSPRMPLGTRMRAAAIALPFESPRLAVTGFVSGNDFASLLEARMLRMRKLEAAKAIAQPEATEVKPVKPHVEIKPRLPTINDRRYRRF